MPAESNTLERRSWIALLVAAGIGAGSSAAAPQLTKMLVIPLRLPGNYQPAALPAQPLDEQLVVGIVPPPFNRGRSATWTEPIRWTGNVDPLQPVPRANILELQRVFINAAEPVAGALPKIFKRLFTRATVLTADRCPTCDLVFVVSVETRDRTGADDRPMEVAATVKITAVAPNGVSVASFSCEGMGLRTKTTYWSTYTEARAMGEPALHDAMENVFAKLVADPSLRTFVAEKTAEHARPSDLDTAVTFDDAASILPNGRLDAGETARLHFRIRNGGGGTAFAVRLRLTGTANGVSIPAETEVGDIPPGGVKEVDVPISAGVDVDTARQQLRVETLEKRGYGSRSVIVQLATQRLKRPVLEISDVSLDDRGSRAHGDGDRQPSNGETLEAVILVRNSGPGDAVGAELTISAVPGVEVIDPSIHVGAIAVNAVKEVRSLLRIPITYGGADFGLTIRATETRGPAVAAVEKQQRWTLVTKRPQIEIATRMFDGNSPRSRGNRDGMANNGEILEIGITASNRGTFPARGVKLQLASPLAELGLEHLAIDVGDLPALAEGAEHRVQVAVPRALGRDGTIQRLPIDVTINQLDFPVSDQLIGLPFRFQSPGLIATLGSQSALVEGKTALFTLDIRNEGALAAEDVKAEVSCDNTGVELLGPSGVPARTMRLSVGAISSQAAAARIQLRAQVRRNVASLAGMLKVLISQRDFGAVTAQTPLAIVKEEPALVSAVPPAVPEPPPSRPLAVPAAVSFQRYRDGTRLAEERIGLPFEVQSQTPIEMVRLEQNHRAIELPESFPLRNGATYVWQYEPQVHLEYGANEFEVVVVTSEGVRSSRSTVVERERPRGKIWLAVIGVSNYQQSAVGNLDFAKEDAVAVEAYYRRAGIPAEQVIELLDRDATLANVKRSLGTDLVKHAANPDDTVLIYFAGHGAMEIDRSSADGDGYSKYLLLHDADLGDLFGSALSMEELSRILQRLRAERVVLIIDSCFSGAAGGRTPYEPNAASRGVISKEFLSRMASAGKGRVILTASGSDEVAQESREKGHGVFTYFLLEGLRGAADLDHDGRVDVDEIYKYVSQKVSLATHGHQNPMRKSPNLSGTVVLGGNLQ
jgi:hypothetical protein